MIDHYLKNFNFYFGDSNTINQSLKDSFPSPKDSFGLGVTQMQDHIGVKNYFLYSCGLLSRH